MIIDFDYAQDSLVIIEPDGNVIPTTLDNVRVIFEDVLNGRIQSQYLYTTFAVNYFIRKGRRHD